METVSEKVFYSGSFVLKKHFRTFVYDKDGNKKLAESWDEYERLLGGKEWFEVVPPKVESKKEVKDGKLKTEIKAPDKKSNSIKKEEEVKEEIIESHI